MCSPNTKKPKCNRLAPLGSEKSRDIRKRLAIDINEIHPRERSIFAPHPLSSFRLSLTVGLGLGKSVRLSILCPRLLFMGSSTTRLSLELAASALVAVIVLAVVGWGTPPGISCSILVLALALRWALRAGDRTRDGLGRLVDI